MELPTGTWQMATHLESGLRPATINLAWQTERKTTNRQAIVSQPFLWGSAISDAAFTMLKDVLRRFTPQELSMFLRFCTGLMRLPIDAKSREGFGITLRHVIAARERSAAMNPDGSARPAADALCECVVVSRLPLQSIALCANVLSDSRVAIVLL